MSFLLLVFSCTTNSGDFLSDEGATPLETEENIEKDSIVIQTIMTSAGSIESYKKINLVGSEFKIVVNDSGDTTHWTTSDVHFKTQEGYQVGTKYSELPVNLKKSLNKINGWGYFIELKSGWKLGFCEGSSCTSSGIIESSTVKWIFKTK